jgi:hypothetical protein
MAEPGIPAKHVRIAKVVGENHDGMTLFVPKDMDGTFNLTAGDRFLTMIFVHQTQGAEMETWIPWEDGS